MLLFEPAEPEFEHLRRAAKEVVRYSYQRLIEAPPLFDDVGDFLSHFDEIEEKLTSSTLAYDVLNDLMELGIAARIASFADDVQQIQSRFLAAAGIDSTSPAHALAQIRLSDNARREILLLFNRWRKRFSVVQDLTLDQLRALPSVTDNSVLDEVRAFDISLRLGQLAGTQVPLPLPVVEAPLLRVSPGGPFQLLVRQLTVFKGEIIALVGPNGSGKTTFLRMVAGKISPVAGALRYPCIDRDTRGDHRQFNWTRRRRRIAMVEEEPALGEMRLDKRIGINLATSGVLGESNRALTNLLMERFRLFGKIRRPTQLSSGERKLAAMACALASMPDLLLLDEPMSSLDYIATVQLLHDIRRIAKGRLWGSPAIIISSHHLDETTWLADRTFFFDDQEVKEFAPSTKFSAFEVVFHRGEVPRLEPPPEVELVEVSGRTFVRSGRSMNISEVYKALSATGATVISVTDISQSPKRSYLGL